MQVYEVDLARLLHRMPESESDTHRDIAILAMDMCKYIVRVLGGHSSEHALLSRW